MRRLWIVAVALLVLCSGAALARAHGLESTRPAKIVFVNVGQGDGVVMRIGGKIIVSDAGEHRSDVVDATLRSLDAKQIDVAILSHPHDDHVKNFQALVTTYGWKIKLAVRSQSLWWEGTKTNRKLMETLRDQNVPIRDVRAGDNFDWGGASWEILNPRSGAFLGGATDAANASIVYLLQVNGIEALFTGDIESRVAEQVADELKDRTPAAVDIFLATHHGSKEGSIAQLLDVIRPKWAVLSVGRNAYEHPSVEAIDRLKAAGASIWCTDANGSVTARISAAGTLTWRASLQRAPWWSAKARRKAGRCVGR
jgi:competence protein ComEC